MTSKAKMTAGFTDLIASAEAWRRGDFEDVIKFTTKAIESAHLSTEDMAIAHYQRGLVYSRKDLYEKAMVEFDESIRLNPDFARAYYQRGFIARKIGQDDHAIDDYNRALRLDPELFPAYVNRGVIYVDKRLYHEAIQDFHRAIRLDPTNPRIYSDRGCAFYGNGNYDRAMEDFNEALRLDPNYVLAHLHRGHVYCVTESYDEALEAYSQAIKRDPEFALAWRNRADVYFCQGQFSDAANDYEAYLKLQPQDMAVIILLYLARVRSGGDGASELAAQAQGIILDDWPGAAIGMFLDDVAPSDVIVQATHDEQVIASGGAHLACFYIGQYYLLQGKTAEAVDMFRQALLDGPTHCFEHTFVEAELKRLGVTAMILRSR